MTPQEKAEELYFKYSMKGLEEIKSILNRVVRKNIAKQCALIAVNEIIDSSPMYYTGFEFESNLEYWQQVKTEIKKL
jgi:hypothetical protein